LKNHQEHAEEDQTLMLCQSKSKTIVITVTENHPEEHAEEELLLL
jgi:hypothetical protein